MASDDLPLVSIGVPVYNGGGHLRSALESLLSQTYPHLELIISDNASTDDTASICREIAARDPRVRYLRQETNIGAMPNFRHVLSLAKGPLFMWGAHDDWWEPDFVEANVAELQRDSGVIGSISKVEFVEIDSWIWKKLQAPHGTCSLMNSVRGNVMRILWNPGTNSRVYSLFRTDVLRQCVDLPYFWGSDTIFVIKTLRYGKYAEVPRYLMKRRRGVSHGMHRFVFANNRTWWGRIFPFMETTVDILKEDHVPKNAVVYLFLLKLNLMHTVWHYKSWAQDVLGRAWGKLTKARESSPVLAPRTENAV